MSPWRCFTHTLRQCCVNMACAPLFLVAIAIYAVYFCWPYMAQLPDHIHCAIVDADNSSISRRLVMDMRATPDLNVLQVTDNRQEAILAMKRGDVSAIVEIPENFAIDTYNAVPTVLRAALDSPLCMLAMQLPVFVFCLIWCLIIEGPVFYLQGINSFQNMAATLVICATFSLAASSFACFTALLLGPTHFVLQGVVLSALPCVFLSGNIWPLQDFPVFFQMLAWIFPSTPGATGIVRASQCGASIGEVGPYLFHLAILSIAYFILARIVARYQNQKYSLPA